MFTAVLKYQHVYVIGRDCAVIGHERGSFFVHIILILTKEGPLKRNPLLSAAGSFSFDCCADLSLAFIVVVIKK